MVLNFDGDRAFVSHMPPQARRGQPEIDRWRAVLRRTRPRWCYLHAGRGVPDFLREARELGAKIALDISLGDERQHRDVVIDCVRLADVFVPNEDELAPADRHGRPGPAVSAAAAWGTPLVVKRGAAGAVVVEPRRGDRGRRGRPPGQGQGPDRGGRRVRRGDDRRAAARGRRSPTPWWRPTPRAPRRWPGWAPSARSRWRASARPARRWARGSSTRWPRRASPARRPGSGRETRRRAGRRETRNERAGGAGELATERRGLSEPKGRAAAWTDERGREERAPERGGKTAGPAPRRRAGKGQHLASAREVRLAMSREVRLTGEACDPRRRRRPDARVHPGGAGQPGRGRSTRSACSSRIPGAGTRSAGWPAQWRSPSATRTWSRSPPTPPRLSPGRTTCSPRSASAVTGDG